MKKMVPNTDQCFENATANCVVKNELFKFLAFIAITLFFAMPAFAQAVGDYRSVNGNWGTLSSWQRLNALPNTWATPTSAQGYPGQNAVPGTVTILNGSAITLNVSPANAIGSLVFESGNTASSLTFNSGTTLNVNGAVAFNGVTGNITKTIAVGAGTLSCASVSMPSTNNDNRKSVISVSTGTFNVSGDISLAGTGVRSQVNITSTGILNLGGDFTGGSFSAGTGTLNCNGSDAQVFGATSPKSFYHFTVNKSGAANTVTSNGGAFTIAGNLTVNQGNLIAAATDADYTVTGNVTVNTNGTLTHAVDWNAAGKLLGVSGNISVDGILTSTVRSHIQMRGAGKTIKSGNNPASAFSILTLTATGSITANGNLTVNDNFWASFGAACNFTSGNNILTLNNGFWINGGTATISGGTTTVQGDQGTLVGRSDGLSGTLNISGGTFTTTDLTVGTTTAANYGIVNHSGGTANIGNLVINNTSTYSRYACSNAPTINISGNWTNDETTANSFTAASSQVNFTGGNTTIKEDDNFYRISINKTSGDLSLVTNMNIADRLDLTSGLITTGANTVSVLTSGTIINANSNSYINGKLARALSTSLGLSKEFPVGKGGYYGPVTITSSTNATARTFTVEQFETGITGTLPANTLAGPRYWTVNASGATATYRIKLDGSYNPAGPVKMLKKEGAADPTANDVTTPNYSNTTLFNSFSGTNSFALGFDCRAYADAGPALADICQGSNTAALGATMSGTATTGAWSTTSGGTFTPNNTDPNATWTPPAGFAGTASLVFTTTNGACGNVSASKDVIVRARPTVTVTGSASVCLSAAYTIPAAAVSYTGTTLSWTHNGTGTLTGANTATPAYTPAAGDAGNNVVLTLSVTNSYNFCTAATGTYTLAVGAAAAGQWKGISGNWNDPANWCGGVPTATSNVTIPVLGAGLFYPSAASGTVLINNLTIANGASVTINGYTLQVKGNITSNHGINVNTGTLEMSGSTAQTISGNYFTANRIDKLVVSNNNGLSVASGVSDSLVITDQLAFGTTDADLNTGDNIILRSTATKTASVAAVAAGNTINGKMTIERYLKNYKSWRFVAAPVKAATSPSFTAAWREGGSTASTGYGVQVTGPSGTGLDEITSAYSIKWYNAATNNYVMVSNMNNAISNKEGYMVFVRGDRAVNTAGTATSTNLRIKGDIQTGDQVYSAGGTKFLSVGNPYPSAISAAALLSAAPSLAGSYYAWDPSIMGSYNAGGYQVLSSLDGFEATVSGSALYPAGSQHPDIQSGQAFYLYNPTAGTVNFNITEAMKSAAGTVAVSRENSPADREFIRVKLYANDSTVADGNMVAFDDELSNDINGDDALKFTNSGENFGIARLGKKLSVEARSRIVTTDTIFYNMSNLRQQAYKLVVVPQNIAGPTLTAFMVDKYLNTQTTINLTDSNFIRFTVDASAASKAADRFMLVFRKVAGPLPVTIVSVSANRNTDKSIAVRWKVENEINMLKYEVERSSNGADFTGILSTAPVATNGGSASYLQNDKNPLAADNFYRIKATSLNGQVQYSSVVKVAGEKITAAVVSVYPNPVENKQMNISFVNQAKGRYNVELVSMSGQVTYKTTVTVNSSNFVETVYLDKNMAAGRYQLRVVAADGTTASQAVFIR